MNTANIPDVFSTRERLALLEKVLYVEGEFRVNDVARKLGLSKALVSNYFEILAREGVVKRRKHGFLVCENESVKALRIMLNVLKTPLSEFKKFVFVKAVGLYGSCAKGTNTASSDVDLWVKTSSNASEENKAELSAAIRKKASNAKLLFLDDAKLKALKRNDSLFYYSLLLGSIMLVGDENEIEC